MSIYVSMKSVVSQTASSTSSGGDRQSAIGALQKKLISLQKDLQEAIKTPTKEGQAKAKLIQVQIVATQAQLEQLVQQKAKESADKQTHNKSEANHTPSQLKSELYTKKILNIDEFA